MFIMGVVRNFKFGLQVNSIKSQPANVKLSLKGAWSGSRDSFLHFGAQAISLEQVRLNISNFKFGLQIERKEYWHYTC